MLFKNLGSIDKRDSYVLSFFERRDYEREKTLMLIHWIVRFMALNIR